MSWSFNGPDGRCTFEFVLDDGELHCQWRRIGDHSIFTGPEPGSPASGLGPRPGLIPARELRDLHHQIGRA